jgi:hypothetical protein
MKLYKILESVLDDKQLLWHITSKRNLKSIKKHGILPKIPADMTDEKEGVYLFKSYHDAEDAVVNWLGDRFDEDDDLVAIGIDPIGVRIEKSAADYEIFSTSPIPSENIKKTIFI